MLRTPLRPLSLTACQYHRFGRSVGLGIPNAAKYLKATNDQGLPLSMLKSVNKTGKGYIGVWKNNACKVK